MTRFAITSSQSSTAAQFHSACDGSSAFGLSAKYIADIEELLNKTDTETHAGTSMIARQPRVMIAAFVGLAVVVSALCASAAVLITSNDADASVTRIGERPVVTSHLEIDERFNSFLRDVRAIEIGPNGLVRIPGSAPVLAMHIEPPAPDDMRGRIEETPTAIPAITIVQDVKPPKKRRVRRIRIARSPAVMREKSLFEALFGVPFPIKLFPHA